MVFLSIVKTNSLITKGLYTGVIIYRPCIYRKSAGLIARLFVGLAIGSTAGIKGVVDYAGPLQAIFTVPVV